MINFTMTTNLAGLQEHRRRVRQRLARALNDTAEAVLARAVASMEEPKSGRFYRVSVTGAGEGFQHQASAPGEAPGIVSHELVESGRVEQVSERQVDVVFTSPHALPLEYGAPARGLAPRPFLGPALLAEVDEFEHRLADALAPVGASNRVRTVDPR